MEKHFGKTKSSIAVEAEACFLFVAVYSAYKYTEYIELNAVLLV